MSGERDTHFAGFAKLLMKEMLSQTQLEYMDFNSDDTEDVEMYSLIIARRAYDLMLNAMDMWGFPPAMLCIGDVPDLKEWPEARKNE